MLISLYNTESLRTILKPDLFTTLKSFMIFGKTTLLLEEQGATVDTSTPEVLAELVKKEVARWKKMVETSKITVD